MSASRTESIKQSMPPGLWQKASDLRYALQRAALWPEATFHPWRQLSIRRMAALQNQHAGQRCFIIGNGPSLKNTDLSRLKDEFTIGMNRFYLAFPELGFQTSYYVSVNSLVIEQCVDDFEKLRMPKFFSWRSHSFFKNGPDDQTMFLHTTYTGPRFATNLRGRLWEGATVTYVAMQLAFYLGFHQVILIGVDHSFATKGKPNATVISQGDDRDHFAPGYFGKGFRWQLPDLETSERAYRMARQAYEASGREMLDATVGGQLQVFPKVDYRSLFS